MASGVPVVTANATSIPGVIDTAAIVFEPGDVDELAVAMRRVLLNPDLSDGWRKAGIERARQFTWAKTAELTRRAFDRAVQIRQHRRA